MAATKTGAGYRVVRADGSVTTFGNALLGGGLRGALGGGLSAPVTAIVTAF